MGCSIKRNYTFKITDRNLASMEAQGDRVVKEATATLTFIIQEMKHRLMPDVQYIYEAPRCYTRDDIKLEIVQRRFSKMLHGLGA